jgi:hypothetical protein
LAARARAALAAGGGSSCGVFVAANVVNVEALLPQWAGALADAARALAPCGFFVSVVESGSTDGTRPALAALGAALTAAGVRHALDVSPAGGGARGWRAACADVGGGGAARARCEAADCGPAGALRGCAPQLRIAVMAALRNRALAPLLAAAEAAAAGGGGGGGGGAALPGLDVAAGARGVTVLFLNDVLLYAADALELLATGGGGYDLACALDFEGLKLYDTWVLRDLSGATASDWHPFFREAGARAALAAGAPARVYSCWNGAVALPAAALLGAARVRFRPWAAGEPRGADAAAGVFDDACPASECALVAADLWAARAAAGAGAAVVLVNPRVRLAYNAGTEALQRTLARAAAALLLSWANRIGATHHALRSAAIAAPLGTPAVPLHPPPPPPRAVACGLAEDGWAF